jgi:hypothetical protein
MALQTAEGREMHPTPYEALGQPQFYSKKNQTAVWRKRRSAEDMDIDADTEEPQQQQQQQQEKGDGDGGEEGYDDSDGDSDGDAGIEDSEVADVEEEAGEEVGARLRYLC